MLPVYIAYFAGGDAGGKGRALKNALGFITGFTIVFVLLGVFAGTLGSLLIRHQTAVNLILGAVVVLFGLSYLGLFSLRMPALRGKNAPRGNLLFFSSMLFGMVFFCELYALRGVYSSARP